MGLTVIAELPPDRWVAGQGWVQDDQGETMLGPFRVRGEADNANAARAGNIEEDPTKTGGDHPFGEYQITEIVECGQEDAERYGPYFLRLMPVSGEAAEGHRPGIGIHGGRLHHDGRLRETFGCLRVDNGTMVVLVGMLRRAGLPQPYECRRLVNAA